MKRMTNSWNQLQRKRLIAYVCWSFFEIKNFLAKDIRKVTKSVPYVLVLAGINIFTVSASFKSYEEVDLPPST